MPRKILVFGNSGSGKSTLARKLAVTENLAHLDLDNYAWLDTIPPQRAPVQESNARLQEFVRAEETWVIEGCYTDLLELLVCEANEIIFLNLPIETCIENARNRPWEPHKYESRQKQDENLSMLLDWIAQYEKRDDVFSYGAHLTFYNEFPGKKTMLTDNNESSNQE